MSALPKTLAKLNLDVKVILPRYKCIPQKFQEKMEYRGSFYMDLCSDGETVLCRNHGISERWSCL